MDVDGATSTSSSSKKRKANASPTSPASPPTNGTTNNDNGTHEIAMDEEEDAGPSSLKKPRIAEPSPAPFVQPVVVDEFETEAKREVAASAGLTGSTEAAGSRLELKHQVCFIYVQFIYCLVSAIGVPLLGWKMVAALRTDRLLCRLVVIPCRVLSLENRCEVLTCVAHEDIEWRIVELYPSVGVVDETQLSADS